MTDYPGLWLIPPILVCRPLDAATCHRFDSSLRETATEHAEHPRATLKLGEMRAGKRTSIKTSTP
jgi:hypothetical protein